MNRSLLQFLIDDKQVSVQEHPTEDLFIYNYTNKVQYERLWNDVTLATRGLILDGDFNVVARPLKKFFNLEEHKFEDIPRESFDVYEKMDGSLGILYWVKCTDTPYIATRGSFTSEQAMHATELLHTKYRHLFDKLDRSATYIFEIIYPQNRIVVDYGDTDDLFLITIIDTETGEERLEDIGFPLVKKLDGINNLSEIRDLELENKEGFVIRFKNGFRVKIKFKEYLRLHRIVTDVSNLEIWRYLQEGLPFEAILDRVPDEFYKWVSDTKNELTNQFNSILQESLSSYKELETRKETALYFLTQKYPKVLFAIYDKKDPSGIIWRMIRPKFEKPFNKQKDEYKDN